MIRDPRALSELAIQKTVVDTLRHCATAGTVFFAVPNGELRDKRTAGKLKAMGVRRGVADLIILTPLPLVGFLELKSARGRVSIEQEFFRADVQRLGYFYSVASSVDEALTILRYWGAIKVTWPKL